METLPSDQVLSPSTRRALRRAQTQLGALGATTTPTVVDEDDLLVSLVIAHGGDNVVVDLLEHYRIERIARYSYRIDV